MNRAGRNNILARKRGRKSEEGKFKIGLSEKMEQEKPHVQTASIRAFL
jgi:hypothetical protein